MTLWGRIRVMIPRFLGFGVYFIVCISPRPPPKRQKTGKICGEYTKVGNSEFYLVKWHRGNFTVASPHQAAIVVMYRLYRRGWSEIERVSLKWGRWVPTMWRTHSIFEQTSQFSRGGGDGEIEGGNREQTESIWRSGHIGMMRARSHW
jgi:hypothetical protein